MNSQLESDVRDALAGRASSISPDVATRLRRHDYRPRGRRMSTGVGVTAGLIGAAATAGIVSAVTLGTSEPAFAGWSSTPSAKAAVLTDSSPEQTCRSQLLQQRPPPGTSAGTQSWTPVAADVRGPYTLYVFESGTADATCLTGPSLTVVSRGSENSQEMSVQGSGRSSGARGNTAASAIVGHGSGDLTSFAEVHLNSADGELTLMDGEIASGVTAVSLARSDGSQVQTTTGNGWFVAWWPGDLSSMTADVTTATGSSSVDLSSMVGPPAPAKGAPTPPGPATCTTIPGSLSQVCRSGGFSSSGSTGSTRALSGGGTS